MQRLSDTSINETTPFCEPQATKRPWGSWTRKQCNGSSAAWIDNVGSFCLNKMSQISKVPEIKEIIGIQSWIDGMFSSLYRPFWWWKISLNETVTIERLWSDTSLAFSKENQRTVPFVSSIKTNRYFVHIIQSSRISSDQILTDQSPTDKKFLLKFGWRWSA